MLERSEHPPLLKNMFELHLTELCTFRACHRKSQIVSLKVKSFLAIESFFFSGGRAGRDPQRLQGRPDSLSVQRQPEHKGRGAGLRDRHQVDQTRPQL